MNTRDMNSWSKYTTWEKVSPPSRPDRWQIEKCRFACHHLSRLSKVAVLGSTIEFRSLLADMGFLNVFVFERNRDFFDYITPFASRILSESFVEGNWLDSLQNYQNTFDVILSDLTSGNIAYEDREAFYSTISKALSSDGIFIDRLLTKNLPFSDLQILIHKYEKLEINNKTTNSFNCEVLFCSSLLNNEKQIVDTTQFYDFLLSYKIPNIDRFVLACYDITPRDCVWWYSKDWELEKITYNKYLSKLAVFDEPTNSEYYGRAKLIISRKRGV